VSLATRFSKRLRGSNFGTSTLLGAPHDMLDCSRDILGLACNAVGF